MTSRSFTLSPFFPYFYRSHNSIIPLHTTAPAARLYENATPLGGFARSHAGSGATANLTPD